MNASANRSLAHRSAPTRRARTPRAFTAFEALLAAAILAIITAAVSGAIMAGRQQSRNAQDTVYASFLARALMEEICRLPITDPLGYTTFGPDPGETSRKLYDNIDDYHGYTDGPNNIADLAGNNYSSEYQPFVRTVTVTATSTTPTGWGRTINGLTITVTVTRDSKTLVTLQRYMCNN